MTPDEYRFAREALHLSRAELAEALGLTRQAVYQREKGISALRKEHALAMGALLKRRSEELASIAAE